MSSDVMEAACLKRWEACATAWAAITCSTAHAGLASVASGSRCVVQAPRPGPLPGLPQAAAEITQTCTPAPA